MATLIEGSANIRRQVWEAMRVVAEHWPGAASRKRTTPRDLDLVYKRTAMLRDRIYTVHVWTDPGHYTAGVTCSRGQQQISHGWVSIDPGEPVECLRRFLLILSKVVESL